MSTWMTTQKHLPMSDGVIAGSHRAQLRFMPALWVMQQLVLQRKPYDDSRFAKAQWVSLVDDDAYVLYANLQAVLQQHSTETAVYTGHVSPDEWLPDHVDGCNIELGVSTNTSFVAGGSGSYFNRHLLENLDVDLCVRGSLPGGKYEGWQSDWMLSRCLKDLHGWSPTVSGHGKFVQFACNEDGVILPCEVSASSEDPETFDDKPASVHPVKSFDQMQALHDGLNKAFGSPRERTISRADVREHLWSRANEDWMEAARQRRALHEERASDSDEAASRTSLQSSQTLSATDPTRWDAFGASLYFAEDLLVTGASSERVGEVSNAGAVYIYKAPSRAFGADGKVNTTEWTLLSRLTAPTPSENAYFGASVSMHRDTIVVGAFGETSTEGVDHAGATYVYVKDPDKEYQWDMVKRMSSLKPQPNLYFGMYVSVHDDNIVVGCPYARTCSGKAQTEHRGDAAICDGGIEAAGAVVTYSREDRTKWKWTGTLTLPAMVAYDYFGQSVFTTSSVTGDWLIAAAHGRDVHDTFDAGAVYAFGKDHDGAWVLRQELTASPRTERAFFGVSLVANSNGDTLLIGATGETEGSFENAGAAYVFNLLENGKWSRNTRLAPPEPRDRGNFGHSVTIYDDSLIVGSKGLVDTFHSGHSNGSAITLFQLGATTFKWEHRAQKEDPHAFGSHFGYSVSKHGLTTAVGAPFTKTGSMALWREGSLASRPKNTELRVHGSVVIIEEEPASQPELDSDGCWDVHDGSQTFCFPHVFLLGAQKAATTSLFQLVHDIGMACPANTLLAGVPRTNNTLNAIKFQNVTHGKEAHIFDLLDARSAIQRDPAIYSRMYELVGKDPACRGKFWDATPNYLSSRSAPQQMLQILPEARLPMTRLIVILRDPIARDLSWFNHRLRYLNAKRSIGLGGMKLCVEQESAAHAAHNTSYAAEVECNMNLLEPCLAVLGGSDGDNKLEASLTACLARPRLLSYRGNPLIDGFYAAHINTWMQAFPRKQMLIVSHEDFVSKRDDKHGGGTTEVLKAIGEFLQVDVPEGKFAAPDLNTASAVGGGEVLEIGCSTKTRLQRLFKPWNRLLFKRLRDHHDKGYAPDSESLFEFEEDVVCQSDDVEIRSAPATEQPDASSISMDGGDCGAWCAEDKTTSWAEKCAARLTPCPNARRLRMTLSIHLPRAAPSCQVQF